MCSRSLSIMNGHSQQMGTFYYEKRDETNEFIDRCYHWQWREIFYDSRLL